MIWGPLKGCNNGLKADCPAGRWCTSVFVSLMSRLFRLGVWVSYWCWRQPIAQFQGILLLWWTLGTVIISWIHSKLCSAALDKQWLCTRQVLSFLGLQIPGHRGQLWLSYDLHDTPVDIVNVLNAFVHTFWRVSNQITWKMTY